MGYAKEEKFTYIAIKSAEPRGCKLIVMYRFGWIAGLKRD